MTMLSDEMSNKKTREALNQYYKECYKPSLFLLAAEVGISYAHFVKFKGGKIDLSTKLLAKIDTFLEKEVDKGKFETVTQ